MNIEIQLFGAFRDFDESGKISVDFKNHSNVSDLKKLILIKLKSKANLQVDIEALMKTSVIATEENLLQENDIINMVQNMKLAILPPVCGG